MDHASANLAAGDSLGKVDWTFTSKEYDPETGLYSFPARYYEPQTSRWMSTDPAMGEYVPAVGEGPADLPGMGGVFAVFNLAVYHYGGNNPLRYVDPDGREVTIEFSMDNPDGEPPIAIIDGEQYGVGYGLDYDIGDVVPDDTVFVSPEGSQLDIQRNGERFRISGAAFHGPSLDEARMQVAGSEELARAKRQNRIWGVVQISIGLSAWTAAGFEAAAVSAAEAATPVPIGPAYLAARGKTIMGQMTLGAVMIGFGLGRVTGQHDSSVFDDLVFAVMPQIMNVNTAVGEIVD